MTISKNKFSVIALVALLSSCTIFQKDYVNEYSPFSFANEYPLQSFFDREDAARRESFNTLTYLDNSLNEIPIESYGDVVKTYSEKNPYRLNNIMGSNHQVKNYSSKEVYQVESQKLLVIPVDFPDYSADKLFYGKEGSKKIIENVFFGESDKTKYESVASFYYRSSFGNLKLTGTVTPWYTYSGITQEEVSGWSSASNKSGEIAYDALKWAIENEYIDYHDYDQDNDGFIDGIFLIYASQTNRVIKDKFFWAYQSFYGFSSNDAFIQNQPYPNAYASASFAFLDINDRKSVPETTTIIHETGHLFGLQDYYDTTGKHSPMGKADMMDFNIGDHNVYSKMILDWIKPITIKKRTTITLEATSTSGDFVLIGNDWNGTPYDEYLLLEFYTPSGLNSIPSSVETSYSSTSGAVSNYQLMKQPGLKVTHVDSSLGYFTYTGSETIHRTHVYTGPLGMKIANNTHIIRVKNNNSYKYGVPLIEVLDPNAAVKSPNYSMSNKTLLGEGAVFKSLFPTFTFSDGSKPFLNFEVDQVTNTKITLSFYPYE